MPCTITTAILQARWASPVAASKVPLSPSPFMRNVKGTLTAGSIGFAKFMYGNWTPVLAEAGKEISFPFWVPISWMSVRWGT